MKKLLFHVCCGPCFIAPYTHLKSSFDITGLWYNHNIHPVTEYYQRRDTLKTFTDKEHIPMIWRDEYGLEAFLRDSVYREKDRCLSCYAVRLRLTAEMAQQRGFDLFSTTLLYSKYQKHEMIKEIGESLAKEYNIGFLYRDLREYWQEGINLSKTEEMYRQPYCGCIYSEQDRYWKESKRYHDTSQI